MKILQENDWDPTTLHAPNPELVPTMESLPDDIPFTEGKDLIVDTPVDQKGVTDVYIDEMIVLTVDIEAGDS